MQCCSPGNSLAFMHPADEPPSTSSIPRASLHAARPFIL